MQPRILHLRRPAVLSMHEGVFVPRGDRDLIEEIDRRWCGLCKVNPAYFDGRLLHVLGVHRNGHGGATVHVMDCAYRYFAVQDQGFDLGMRALGVKGITMHKGQVLLGRRSEHVAFYRNMWEFAPGGSVCPNDDPATVVQRELEEEAGIQSAQQPTAVAMIFDPVLRCWEIVFRMSVAHAALQPHAPEYSQLKWCDVDELPQPLSPIAQQMVELL